MRFSFVFVYLWKTGDENGDRWREPEQINIQKTVVGVVVW